MPSSPRALMLLLAVTLPLCATGCSTNDKHIFLSTVNQPTTITLLDANHRQSVWEMDIPVNHQLVLDFENDGKNTEGRVEAASWVDWQLIRTDAQPRDTGIKRKGVMVRSDRVDLTGTHVRIQVSYRPAPELPGSLDAAPVPVMETPESVAAEAAAEAKAQAAAATEEALIEEATAEEETTEEVTEEAAEMVDQAVEEVEAVEVTEEAEIVEEAEVTEEFEVVEEAEVAEEVEVIEEVEEAETAPVEDATK